MLNNTWDTIEKFQSSDENVMKFVFTKSDAVVETVLYKYPTYADRTVICCSVMSGCPIGCRFCGTGDYFVRNLSGQEIVSQVETALAETGIDPNKMHRLQIMTMSMGEPLLNRNGLTEALSVLHDKYPAAALLISTSAPEVNMQWFSDLSVKIPTIGLQFSVHESTDEARNALIPFKNKMDLERISEAGTNWYNITGRNPFFNYCAHSENTSDADADRLLKLFDPLVWQSTISVICERDETIAQANDRQRELAEDFMEKLMNRGYSTRCFNPAGQDDISGGCGQLAFAQRWFKNNPDKARASCGSGLPIVHMPTSKKGNND